MLTKELVEQAATVFDTWGADAWYERPLEEFVTPGLGTAKQWAIAGCVLLVAAMIATGVNAPVVRS